MDLTEIKGWLDTGKAAVELLKGAAVLLPKGDKRSEIEKNILAAENTLLGSDAKLAKELGMKLCDCRFPPHIMLWQEAEKAHFCPNHECGRKKYLGIRVSQAAMGRLAKPSGRNSWMAK
jgi:hypothetical protein